VKHTTGLESSDVAERAVTIVAGVLCSRMMPEQARHFIAQLPSKLHPELNRHLDGPDRDASRKTLRNKLALELGIDEDVADDLMPGICTALAESVSVGELEAVRSQLPASMKDLFPVAFVLPERRWERISR